HVQLPLQPGDGLAHGRGGNALQSRRRRETPMIGHLHESLQAAQAVDGFHGIAELQLLKATNSTRLFPRTGVTYLRAPPNQRSAPVPTHATFTRLAASARARQP